MVYSADYFCQLCGAGGVHSLPQQRL